MMTDDVKKWINCIKLFDKALIKKLSTRHVYDVEIEYPDDEYAYCNDSFSSLEDAIKYIVKNDGHKVIRYGTLYLRMFVDGKRINDEDLSEVIKLCKEYELTIKGN